MESPEIISYLIVCPLVFLAGFIDAIAGGGGLISLPAYLLAGLPPHMAIGTNKLSSAVGTTVATAQYASKGYMLWTMALPSCILALLGSWVGSQLSLLVPDRAFMIVMLIALPLIAFYVFTHKTLARDAEPSITTRTWIVVLASAFFIGMYDGFYGPGTGTFLMLLLTGMAHLTLRQSAGITKVINLSSNIMSLCVFLLNGTVVLQLGLAAAVFSVAGNYLGARSFIKKGETIARPVIITVLTILIVKVIYDGI